MSEKLKNFLVGIFVITGIGLIVFLILFIKPHVGDGKELLYVRFSNINKINVGTRVTYAGRPVGEVVDIHELRDPRAQPSDELGRVYFYQLTLKVDSSVQVYTTDEITLQTSGLLGEKSVAIIPKAPPRGVVPKLVPKNQPIYGNSIDPIENTFYKIASLATEIEDTFKNFHSWIDENKETMTCALQGFSETMSEASVMLQSVNKHDIIGSFKCAAEKFNCLLAQFNEAMCEMKEENTFQNLGETVASFKNIGVSVDSITKDLADGKGTLGKMLKGDDFYLSLTAIMSKIDTLMNDINHYGLLFNNNKQWQRLRTQRANAMNALNSPQEFKDYFTQEVDLINTAMERLSMVVERSEEKGAVMQTDAFKKDFAELMRKVDTLSDNLRYYNQMLMETSLDP